MHSFKSLITATLVLVVGGSLGGAFFPADARAEDAPRTLHILPIGDSNTYGWCRDIPGGYRFPLQQALNAAGYEVDFLGTVNGPQPKTEEPQLPIRFGDLQSEGWPGCLISSAPEGHFGLPVNNLDAEANKIPADFILLIVGTNDVNLDWKVGEAPARLEKLAEVVHAKKPEATLLIGTLPPIVGPNSADRNARAVHFNAALPQVVDQLRTEGTAAQLVEINAALDPAADMSDDLHMNVSGYYKVGEAWAQAILDDLAKTQKTHGAAPDAVPAAAVTPAMAPPAEAPPLATVSNLPYAWTRARLGGGGWTHGLYQHPNRPGVKYARGDVWGLERWNGHRWEQLMDGIVSSNSPGSIFGATGFAIAPNAALAGQPDTVFAAFGSNPNYWRGLDPKMGIYKSLDGGTSWKQVLPILAAGNVSHTIGEPLQVDPLNANVVYFGSQSYKTSGDDTPKGGLWRSTGAGETGTWHRIESLPIGTAKEAYETGYGCRVVLLDPRTAISGAGIGVVGQVSKTIYAYNYSSTGADQGMFSSTDGGATFAKMPQQGAPQNVRRLALGPGRSIFATAPDGIYQFDGVGHWSQLQPTAGVAFTGIDSDPADRTRLVAISERNNGGEFWVSTNAGQTWNSRQYYWDHPENFNGVSYQGTKTFGGNGVVLFDKPSTQGNKTPRVWVGGAFAVTNTDGLFGDLSAVKWNYVLDGLEGFVVREMRSPPSPSKTILHTGVSDMWGFRVTDLDQWAQQNPPLSLSPGVELTSIAFGENNATNTPWNVVLAAGGGIFTSTDDGATWSKKNLPSPMPWGLGPTNIAISATDKDNVVCLVPGLKTVYYTRNAFAGGETIRWESSQTQIEEFANNGSSLYEGHKRLAADKVIGGKFYLMKMQTDNEPLQVWVSTDGGANWAIPAGNQATVLPHPNWTGNSFLFTPPGANEVWLGNGEGLFRSQDGAANFSKLASVKSVKAFAFGAPASGRTNATLFLEGTVIAGRTETEGLFRSVDEGASFVRINDAEHYFADVRLLEGDRQVFGRVFVSNGSGVIVGTPALH